MKFNLCSLFLILVTFFSCNTDNQKHEKRTSASTPQSSTPTISTKKLSASTSSTNQQLLQGKWVSDDDEKSVIEVNGNQWNNVYEGEQLTSGTYTFQNFCSPSDDDPADEYLSVVGSEGDTLCYGIAALNSTTLTLIYESRGNILVYTKKK